MSGVSRLRSARKGGGSLPIEYGNQKTDVRDGVTQCDEPKDFGAPKKKGAWEVFPNTGVPEGNESPHRGEAANPGNREKSIK